MNRESQSSELVRAYIVWDARGKPTHVRKTMLNSIEEALSASVAAYGKALSEGLRVREALRIAEKVYQQTLTDLTGLRVIDGGKKGKRRETVEER